MDETEAVRKEMIPVINADPGSREALEEKHGQVWDTGEMTKNFEAIGFMAPLVVVRERNGEQRKGSLMFQDRPRFYFDFTPE